jgi:hypothetical protein
MTFQTHSEIKLLQAIRSIPIPTDGDTLIVPVNIGQTTNNTIQQLANHIGCDRTKLIRYLIVQGLLALLPTDSSDQQEQRDYVVEGRSE